MSALPAPSVLLDVPSPAAEPAPAVPIPIVPPAAPLIPEAPPSPSSDASPSPDASPSAATKMALEEMLKARRLQAEAPPLRGEVRHTPLPTGVAAIDGLLRGGGGRRVEAIAGVDPRRELARARGLGREGEQ